MFVLKSADISADILYCLSDYKKHTYQQLADEVECSYTTIRRHIQALAYKNTNIIIFQGGFGGGGVQLIPEQKVSVEKLTADDLQFIIEHLNLLQNPNASIKAFINNLTTQKDLKEIV